MFAFTRGALILAVGHLLLGGAFLCADEIAGLVGTFTESV